MPIVRIHCDGGLGNRFGPIVDGLIFAERSGFSPLIHWPINTNCAAGLYDLFEHVPAEYSECLPPVDWPLVGHMPWEGREYKPLSELNRVKTDFEFTNNMWSASDEQGKKAMSRFKILPSILEEVDSFCEEHGINKDCYGVHVRATDNLSSRNLNYAEQQVKSRKKVFICSDEQEIEDHFNKYQNVVTRKKKFYVEKIVPGGWRIPPPPNDPTKCYNVNRTKESVVEAFIDLLILSRTNFSCIGSTFCKLAKLF